MNSSLIGQPFSVLLMGETAEGEDDWAVFSGALKQSPSGLFLDRGTKPPFEIRTEWIERIKPVGSDVKDILLSAEYYLSLSVGPIPEGESLGFTLQAVPGVRTVPAGTLDDPTFLDTGRGKFRHVFARTRREWGKFTSDVEVYEEHFRPR